MSKYVIRHGAFVELSDDQLMHWKYIKREKLPNGKWRYYYDYGQYAEAEMNKAKSDMNDRKKSYDDAVKDSRYFRKKFSDTLKTGNKHYEYADHYKAQKKGEQRKYESLKRSVKNYKAAVKKYEETPLYKLRTAKSNINKGAKAITKSLSKLFSKKK